MKFLVASLGINPPTEQYVSVGTLHCDEGGIKGDKHYGDFVPISIQEHNRLNKMGLVVPRERGIANGRQLTAVADFELGAVANKLKIDNIHVGAEQLSANILFSLLPEESLSAPFTLIPPRSYIAFSGNSRAIIEVHFENFPCVVAGQAVEDSCGIVGIAKKFPKAAMHKRGLVLKVFSPGKIEVGDIATVYPPH